jgi:hypothetical protein
MIENLKKISNPLTIIAVYAALAEISATTAFSFSDPELQKTFIWFVMLFPTLLVVLFFITWNFNPKVMYAPSDFKDESNFISTLSGFYNVNNQISITEDNINSYIENPKIIDVEIKEGPNKLIIIPPDDIAKFANEIFDKLLKNLQNNFENKEISKISFGVHSPNYFLLSINYSESLSKNIIAPLDQYIMFFKKEFDKIYLDIIGKNIHGDKVDQIVGDLMIHVKNRVESMKPIAN